MWIFRSFLFVLLSVVLLVGAWTFGSPPAASLFWQQKELQVVDYLDKIADTGWGTQRIVEARLADPESESGSVTLILDPVRYADIEAVMDDYPAGSWVRAKVSPGGAHAYPSDAEPVLQWPAIFLTIFLLPLGAYNMPFRIRRKGLDGVRFAGLSIAFVFLVLPAVLTISLWQWGDPPATSIAWDRGQAEVLQSRYETFPMGNGTLAARVIVDVRPTAGPPVGEAMLQGVHYSSITPSAAKALVEKTYRPGAAVATMISPDGEIYERKWRFQDVLSLAVTIMLPVFAGIGFLIFRIVL